MQFKIPIKLDMLVGGYGKRKDGEKILSSLINVRCFIQFSLISKFCCGIKLGRLKAGIRSFSDF